MRSVARFPSVGAGEGHYESFYLKACHPAERMAIWIRYTVHKRPDRPPTGSLWFTLFDGGPRAVKQTLPRPAAGPGEYVRIGESCIAPGRAGGSAEGGGHGAAWELGFDSASEPLHHLPRRWMYRSPLPRTKLLSPHPDARFDGWARIDGRRVDLTGWRGMVGHNWGAQHAERWIWIHAAGFAEDPGGWIDVALGRIRIGGVTTPWIANGALSLEGERLRVGGLERMRRTEVRESPDSCEFVLPGSDLTVQGLVAAAPQEFVGWVYADPDGSEHHTVNCSVADMTLGVSRPGRPARTLEARGSAAYELGMRDTDHGVEIQPFADG